MGIGSSFSIGRSALAASQLGIQVSSNNLANAATPGYARQVLGLAPVPGNFAGRGVSITGIQRQIDEALSARLNGSISQAAAAEESLRILSGIETTLNELTDLDLSSELSAFFTSFSELANGTQSQTQVIEQGELLAGFLQRIREDLSEQRNQIDTGLGALVDQADGLTEQIAALNEQIANTEGAGQQNNALRDRRDELVRELSELVEVSAVEQPSGAINVLIGSSPVVLGSRNQGLTLRETPAGDSIERVVAVDATGQVLDIREGRIGGVLSSRDGELQSTIDTLDELAGSLIFEINRLHSTGATAEGLTEIRSSLLASPGDQSLALNDPLNRSLADGVFAPSNGGFVVRVQDTASGAISTTRIDIDLDGIDSTGAAGFGDDTSIADIAAQLDAVSGLTAAVAPDGRLTISAEPGASFSFGDDTAGVLAVLGVNSYFEGTDAGSIRVRQDLRGDPAGLMTGRYVGGAFVENATSLAIAERQDTASDLLGGDSIGAFWQSRVQQNAVRTATAASVAEASSIVRDNLDSERLALSGVDSDEEALQLLAFQRQYQGAARIIQTSNDLLDELLAIV
ncbi:MAG: flagellar hook-associated protein FlgK [Planctomycetota bacterium]